MKKACIITFNDVTGSPIIITNNTPAIEHLEVIGINAQIKDCIDINNEFSTSETVYLSKSCTLERDRIKNIFQNNNHKKTSISDYSTVTVLEPISLGLLEFQHYYEVKHSTLLFLHESNVFRQHDLPIISTLLSYFEKNTIDILLIQRGLPDYLEDSEIGYPSRYTTFSYWGGSKQYQIIQNIIECLNNKKAKFISSKVFDTKFIQSECVTIDYEMFTTLDEMVKSSDTENLSLLANMIDNCNLNESHFYINLLITQNIRLYDKISERTKQFLKSNSYLYSSGGNMKYCYHNMLQSRLYKYDPFKVNLLKQLLQEAIRKNIYENLSYIFPDSSLGELKGLENLEIVLKY